MSVMNHNRPSQRLWISLVIMLLIPCFAIADPALRYQRASGRVERRDDRASGRIDNQQERSGQRIEDRGERRDNRTDRRDERIDNRIERRDMLSILPKEALLVSVSGGARYYKVGGLYYKPAFYQGETVYVQVDIE